MPVNNHLKSTVLGFCKSLCSVLSATVVNDDDDFAAMVTPSNTTLNKAFGKAVNKMSESQTGQILSGILKHEL
ncbi:unnamed protein product [Fusarium venenatum]|uniref:FAS1 domain-containing protein n=1 Tax=Fusarium venenatum TaxID=56646 RepID=A0A2L2T3Y1_9HYPO|nr:uncharacterized protein FVRRES_06789 [Fusarium venenatum]CEI62353.1 unnamed protein product [Fusarium venenatum]